MGGCPAAGGKGETFCVPTVLSCEIRGLHFIFHDQFTARGRDWAASTKRVLTATMGSPAETGRCTKRKVWQMLCFFAFLLPLLERLQLTVLVLLLAPLSQRPPCEPASKCKQCVNEWSETK